MCCWNGFATHFVENGSIVMYVARDGFYKMGAGNFHDQLILDQPQKKSSIKWHWVLRGGSIYKMGSTKWGGPTPPTLKTRWIAILFCARPHPFCRENRRGDGQHHIAKQNFLKAFTTLSDSLDELGKLLLIPLSTHFRKICFHQRKSLMACDSMMLERSQPSNKQSL